MNSEYIRCPKCGNPRCFVMHSEFPEGWFVWCPAPRCNINGPRATTAEKAIDGFLDTVKGFNIDKCPICGEKAYIKIGWRNGHSDFIFSHEKAGPDWCPANRVIHFQDEIAVKKWIGSQKLILDSLIGEKDS